MLHSDGTSGAHDKVAAIIRAEGVRLTKSKHLVTVLLTAAVEGNTGLVYHRVTLRTIAEYSLMLLLAPCDIAYNR